MKVSRIKAFRFSTRSPMGLSRFYTGLGFTAEEIKAIPAGEMEILGLQGSGLRLPLKLGQQRLDLDYFGVRGDLYPKIVNGADTRFQHIAIVTDDAAAAWKRARALGAQPISRGGPVTLPESSGGVTAMKFRDPEGRPLEFLQFPKGNSRWVGSGILGIDHSAISVADHHASRRFYEGWNLCVEAATLNCGAAQIALDGLDGSEVDVVPMMPRVATPHLELLAYRKPSSCRMRAGAVADVASTRIVWAANTNALVRDPDGHLHHLTTEG